MSPKEGQTTIDSIDVDTLKKETAIVEDMTLEDPEESITADNEHYTNYVRPPAPKVLPPAKYKLWFLVFLTVWFAEWFSSLCGFYPAVRDTFHLSHFGTLFIVLGTIVATLIFGAIEVVITFGTFTIDGVVYGVGPWLKQPRIQWVHEYNNFFAICCRTIVHILEEGFDIFAKPPPPAAKAAAPKQFESAKADDVHQDVVLRIISHVREDKFKEYEKWVEQLKSLGCLSRPGMKKVVTNFDQHPADGIYVWFITFSTVDALNEFMTSPVHDRMVRNLQPLLVTKTSYQLAQERELPDAFTDIATPQAQAVPKLLPKKWKVWTLTTLGLWFTFVLADVTLESHYYEEWGINDAHSRAAATAKVLFNTFFNVYVFTPFLTMVFGHWLQRKENEQDTLEPWRSLNDGLPNIWYKLALSLLYYGGCLIGWAAKQ